MEEGKKRGLVIGINQYDKGLGFDALTYAEADAREVYEIFKNKKVAEFEEVVLVDKNQTSTEVQQKLADILNKTQKDDVIVIYFAGHGKLDKRDRLCLVTTDTEINKLRATSVPLDNINRMIEEVQCKGVVLIIDSCYSGSRVESLRGEEAEVLAESFRTFSGPEPVPETIIISAAERLARERQDLGHGIFTKHLIEGLRKEADEDKDGYVSVEDLFNYVNRKVIAETNSKQKPHKWPKDWSITGKVTIAKHVDTIEKKRAEIAKTELEKKLEKLDKFYYDEEEFTAAIYKKAKVILRMSKVDLTRQQRKYLDQIESLLGAPEEAEEAGLRQSMIEEFLDTWNRMEKLEQAEIQRQAEERDNRRRLVEDRQKSESEQGTKAETSQELESARATEPVSQRAVPTVPTPSSASGERGRPIAEQPREPAREPKFDQLVRDQVVRDLVFVSYSHKDKQWLEELKKWLKTSNVEVWDDSKIRPGQEWREEIQKALLSAKAAILLVSQDFLTSEFIEKKELEPLLEEAQKGGVTILWVAVRHSSYEQSGFERFQSLNDPSKPLDSFERTSREKALREICEKIRDAVKYKKSTQR